MQAKENFLNIFVALKQPNITSRTITIISITTTTTTTTAAAAATTSTTTTVAKDNLLFSFQKLSVSNYTSYGLIKEL